MDAFRLAGLAAVTALLCLTLKSVRPELAMQTAIAGGAVILMTAAGELTGLFAVMDSIRERLSAGSDLIMCALRVTGTAFLTQIASELCRDAGENALAAKAELCGRLMILSAAAPLFIRLVETIAELIGELPV